MSEHSRVERESCLTFSARTSHPVPIGKFGTRSNHALVSFLVVGLSVPCFSAEKPAKLKAEEIVAKHLDAIGTSEARAAVHSRLSEGTVQFNENDKQPVHLEGKVKVMSQGTKYKSAFEFSAKEYPGEQFVFDGNNVQVAAIDPQHRSRLASFMFSASEVLSDGLWSGVLGTGWALPNLQNSGAKLKSDGIKKMDGRELYEVSYTGKKQNEQFVIHLYFEPDTFRHVMTTYRLPVGQSSSAQGKGTPSGDNQGGGEFGEIATTVEERFSDFRVVDGLTLPAKWEIHLRIEPSRSSQYEWTCTLNAVKNNAF
jgi:hypothetical protein